MLLDPDKFTVLPNGIIVLQYNPDTLTRTLKIKGAEEGGDRSEALRLTGPPVETIKLDAEIDATDQLEIGDQNTMQYGISPQLAALETMVYPSSATLQNNFNLVAAGSARDHADAGAAAAVRLEREPHRAGADHRSQHHRGGLRSRRSIRSAPRSVWACACSRIDDLNFTDKGGSLYMAYQQQKENLAAKFQGGTFSALGISGVS